MGLHVNLSTRSLYANLREADALHVQNVQRTKDIAKVDFTWSTNPIGKLGNIMIISALANQSFHQSINHLF